MTKSEKYLIVAIFLGAVFCGGFFSTRNSLQEQDKTRRGKVSLQNQVEELQWELAYTKASLELYRAQVR